MTAATTATYVTMAAMAASAAGNYMQQQNNNESTKAQYAARDAAEETGVQNQDKIQAEAQVPLNNAVQNFTPGNQNASLGDLVAARKTAIADNTKIPSSIIDPTSNANAPQVVQDSLAQKMGNATAYTTQQGNALGTLGGLNDQNVANNLALNSSGNQIGMYDQFAKGQSVADQASANADYNNARKSPSVLGQLLSTGGNIGSMAGSAAGGLDGIGNLLVGANPTTTATGMTSGENALAGNANASAFGGQQLPWLQ